VGWHDLVVYAVEHDWGGIENLSLIPGTVGAAPLQNIGAYGVEIKEVIKNVEAIDMISGQLKVFTNRECAFDYRESVFKQKLKGKYFISSVTLTLTKKNHRFNTSYGAIETTLTTTPGTSTFDANAISDAVISDTSTKVTRPEGDW
jgi:UDP-N-acetylmuramate dehydrogenase